MIDLLAYSQDRWAWRLRASGRFLYTKEVHHRFFREAIMRIVFVDRKTYAVNEPQNQFPSLVDAIAALDDLFRKGFAMFGQVLDTEGKVLSNHAPDAQTSALFPAGSSAGDADD
jgi:hypothetical protein